MRFFRKLGDEVARRKSPPPVDEQPSNSYGLDLKSGDRHYRAWVGPPEDYDTIAALQVSLLFASGLRETHYFGDVGCGSLRAGRMLIPYLRPGRYFGLEPEEWLVKEGIERELGYEILNVKRPQFHFASDFSLEKFDTKFDFVVAQSVFSHCFPSLLSLGLDKISNCLGSSGRLLATYNEAPNGEVGKPRMGPNSQTFPNGWVRKGGHTYSWAEMEEYLLKAGLVGNRLRWPHPRQKWFVAARPDDKNEIEELSDKLRNPLPGWGKKVPRRRKQSRNKSYEN